VARLASTPTTVAVGVFLIVLTVVRMSPASATM